MYHPIDFRQYFLNNYFNESWLNNASQKYQEAKPFPHIVIDNFLPDDVLSAALEKFDDYDPRRWQRYVGDTDLKLASTAEMFIPQIIRSILHELNSGFFLNWLVRLTGIQRLLSDTRLHGGGLHKIESGGYLHIHKDFNVLENLGIERQLNLLLYLNKHWKDEYGGHLELWNANKTKCELKLAPIFNRCVIFNTTGNSWHGHPTPLNTPHNISRKSLALYYYNVNEQEVNRAASKYHSTLYEP